MKLQIACALFGVAMGTRGVVGDEELEWWKEDHWTYESLWEHFDCFTLLQSERLIPSIESWMKLRQAYVNVVGSDHSSIGEPSEVDGFFAPVEARQSPGKGRGLFATEDIPRGQHIWSGSIQGAKFDNGLDFMKFLDLISDEDGAICEVLQFGYIKIYEDGGNENEDNARINVDLDNAGLMNTMNEIHEINSGCRQEWNDRFRGGCTENQYALRDIKKGEEILEDYESSIFFNDGWEWFLGPESPVEEYDDEEADGEEHYDEQADDEEQELEWWKEDHWTYESLWEHFDCFTLLQSERLIPSIESWMKLRQAYVNVVGSDHSSIGEPSEVDGFFAPVEARQSPGKGRGLFATEDIPRGQHIWSGSIQGAKFDNGLDFMKFLDLISDEDGAICEVLQFGYIKIYEDGGNENEDNARINVDLDNAGLTNEMNEIHETNSGCRQEWNDRFRGGCTENYYALRDIKKGEEILEDYQSSLYFNDGWEWFLGPESPVEEYDDEEVDGEEYYDEQADDEEDGEEHYDEKDDEENGEEHHDEDHYDQEDDDEENYEDDGEEHDEFSKCHGSRECCDSDEWWKVDGCHIPDVAAFLWCEEFDEPLLVYRRLQWKKLRQTYYDIVGKNASSILTPTGEDGFFVSFKKSESPRKLYAAQDIAKGHHIWTGTKQTAIFDNPTDYKTFLVRLPSDRACDILHFLGYVEIFGDENGENKEDYRILVDLDDWAYVNYASNGKQANAGCRSEQNDQYIGGCKRNAYALRDIKEGEEILIEKGLEHSWDRVGLS